MFSCPGQGPCPPGFVCIAEQCVLEGSRLDGGAEGRMDDAGGDDRRGVDRPDGLDPRTDPMARDVPSGLSVSAVNPPSFWDDEPVTLTITGTGFATGASVSVGANPLQAVNVIGPTQLTG